MCLRVEAAPPSPVATLITLGWSWPRTSPVRGSLRWKWTSVPGADEDEDDLQQVPSRRRSGAAGSSRSMLTERPVWVGWE